jgi:cytochrome c oxidase cbb3-type subunit 3
MKTGKIFNLTLILLLLSLCSYSQETVDINKGASFPQWASNPAFYIIGFLLFILVLTIYVLYNVNVTLLKIIYPDSIIARKPENKNLSKEKKQSSLRKLYLKLVDSVPVEKEKDVLLDHDYDGIKELDNNLPPWWKYGFYFTIVFAIIYLLYYTSGAGSLPADEYKAELAEAAQLKADRIKANADFVNEENVVLLADAENLMKGKETFAKYCIACHRADGGGQVGPNLTDEFWIHGGGIKNVFSTITNGVPSKGMISWKSQISPKQIQEVASFVISLKETHPQDPKEPQGDKWQEEPVAMTDSTAKLPMASNDTLTNK